MAEVLVLQVWFFMCSGRVDVKLPIFRRVFGIQFFSNKRTLIMKAHAAKWFRFCITFIVEQTCRLAVRI